MLAQLTLDHLTMEMYSCNMEKNLVRLISVRIDGVSTVLTQRPFDETLQFTIHSILAEDHTQSRGYLLSLPSVPPTSSFLGFTLSPSL